MLNNKIAPRRSFSAASIPLSTDIREVGELVINWADGKFYTKNQSGQVLSLSVSGGGVGSGSGVVWQTVPLSPSSAGSNGDIAYDDSFFYVKATSGWRRTAIASWSPLGAPTSVTASPGDNQATVSWTAPADNGGYSITDYLVQFSTNGGTSWTTFSDGTSTATSATVTGLTNGTATVFRVAAVNAIGTGPYSSASSSVTPLPSVSVQYLVVGGGGGGANGGNSCGGGGGAGGYLTGTGSFARTTFAVTVGAGGAQNTNGQDSVFGQITAVGGGRGGQYGSGYAGGSGGGGGTTNDSADKPGGSGTTGQGYAGGSGRHLPGQYEQAGGGGGAGGAGGDAFVSGEFVSANGGPGLASSITGTSVYRAGGGGGGGMSGGTGGTGGGGTATANLGGGNGTDNTGGGGGGTRLASQTAGAGGSGVVILRLPTSAGVTISGGLTYSASTVSSDTVYSITAGTGTVTFS